MEKASASSSTAVGISPGDLFGPPAAGDSTGNSITSATAQALHFSSGNPTIEEIRGVVHLYANDVASSADMLPVGRKPLLCVLGVPNHITYSDFCQFCGSFIQNMSEMRIVRSEGLENQYSILIRLDSQQSADSFYKHFNGKQFSSFEEETCRVFFTLDIQYTASIEHIQPSLTTTTDQPSCPVCLERLEQDSGGILITICNHSFHCSCISKWADSSCPVCRYCQQQPEKSLCHVCRSAENLWMCLLCGFIGCGREEHAINHWKDTQHCYSLELETQRVWDYAGDNYVHRLILSKTDGKLVELNDHYVHTKNGHCDSVKCCGSRLDCEIECIVNEYNDLLASQLESQKNYYESLLQEIEDTTQRESSVAIEKALSQSQRLQNLQAALASAIKENSFLDDVNDNIQRNLGIWETKIAAIEERGNKLVKEKDKRIGELEEMLTNLLSCLEANAESHSQSPGERKERLSPPAEESPSMSGSSRIPTMESIDAKTVEGPPSQLV